jgi:hypothetical protein
MRNLLIALTGFLVGTGLVVGLVLAMSQTNGVTAKQPSAQRVAMPQMSAGMSAMSSGTVASASLATQKLTIQHVQKGCHVWSDGQTTGAMMRLHLKAGQKLSILDQDVDAHQMMELAGPRHLRMGGPMMTSHGMTVAFMKKGVYRLGTKTVEMKGGGMDVKTVGPDNNLRLLVTVA